MDGFCINLEMDDWSSNTYNWYSFLNDLKSSNDSVNKISVFFFCQPDLLKIILKVGKYYFWFYTNGKKVREKKVKNCNNSAIKSFHIYDLQI